ncbi:hypothetical protein ACFLYX_04240 [Chloroflexota bacterium]
MWRSKKVIAIAVLAALILVGSIGGVVLAQTGDEVDSQHNIMLTRVAEILGIDQQTLEDAFTQARTETHDAAMDSYLQNLIDEGKITEEEADQYKEWRQAMPDVPFGSGYGEYRHGGGRGMGGMHGSGGFGGFSGLCAPTQ